MLLAAGAGSRLKPLTDRVPKPLAPIANVPLIEHTLSWLARQEVHEVMINVHHHANRISREIGDGGRFGLGVSYSAEEELLGTGGAVARCSEFFEEEPFFVIYGDNLIEANLQELHQFHKSHRAAITIGLMSPDDPTSSGMVEVGEHGLVLNFVEKPNPGESGATKANAGVYVMDPSLLKTMAPMFSDFGLNLIPAWIAEGRRVFAADLGGYLQDTGTPDRYRKANWDVLSGKMSYKARGTRTENIVVGDNAHISTTSTLLGRNLVGDDCMIDADARLTNCILWRGVTIGRACNLDNVIVGEGAIIEAETYANDAILV
jgi:NDP-sugar pyrophosphorylase family protein